jgi:hypothetical protein
MKQTNAIAKELVPRAAGADPCAYAYRCYFSVEYSPPNKIKSPLPGPVRRFLVRFEGDDFSSKDLDRAQLRIGAMHIACTNSFERRNEHEYEIRFFQKPVSLPLQLLLFHEVEIEVFAKREITAAIVAEIEEGGDYLEYAMEKGSFDTTDDKTLRACVEVETFKAFPELVECYAESLRFARGMACPYPSFAFYTSGDMVGMVLREKTEPSPLTGNRQESYIM